MPGLPAATMRWLCVVRFLLVVPPAATETFLPDSSSKQPLKLSLLPSLNGQCVPTAEATGIIRPSPHWTYGTMFMILRRSGLTKMAVHSASKRLPCRPGTRPGKARLVQLSLRLSFLAMAPHRSTSMPSMLPSGLMNWLGAAAKSAAIPTAPASSNAPRGIGGGVWAPACVTTTAARTAPSNRANFSISHSHGRGTQRADVDTLHDILVACRVTIIRPETGHAA